MTKKIANGFRSTDKQTISKKRQKMAANLEQAMRYLLITNYRNIEGLCRCPQHDASMMQSGTKSRDVSCPFGKKCFLFHESVDCAEFVATGTCSKTQAANDRNSDKQNLCKLAHNVEKHRYCLRQPFRKSITAQHKEFWQKLVKNHGARNPIIFKQFFDRCTQNNNELAQLWQNIANTELRSDVGQLTLAIINFIKCYQKMCNTGRPTDSSTSGSAEKAKIPTCGEILRLLEQMFRLAGMRTWIVARKFDPDEYKPHKMLCMDLLEQQHTKSHTLWLICRPPTEAVEEFCTMCDSYDENLALFDQIGILMVA